MSDKAKKTKPASVTMTRKDGSTAVSHGAARGYSRAPFAKGNLAALRHGAFSEQILSAHAAELHEDLIARHADYLQFIGADDNEIEKLCRVNSRMDLLFEHVMDVAETGGVGEVRPYLWSELNKAESKFLRLANSQGLTPAGRIKILEERARRVQALREGACNDDAPEPDYSPSPCLEHRQSPRASRQRR